MGELIFFLNNWDKEGDKKRELGSNSITREAENLTGLSKQRVMFWGVFFVGIYGLPQHFIVNFSCWQLFFLGKIICIYHVTGTFRMLRMRSMKKEHLQQQFRMQNCSVLDTSENEVCCLQLAEISVRDEWLCSSLRF